VDRWFLPLLAVLLLPLTAFASKRWWSATVLGAIVGSVVLVESFRSTSLPAGWLAATMLVERLYGATLLGAVVIGRLLWLARRSVAARAGETLPVARAAWSRAADPSSEPRG
jgi:hypothetical protein